MRSMRFRIKWRVSTSLLSKVDDFRNWHIASFRCNAMIRRLSKAERTLASQLPGVINESTCPGAGLGFAQAH